MKAKKKRISVPKIKSIQLMFLICFWIIRMVVLMVFLSSSYHISPYYNKYQFINILNIEICIDIIYILVILFLNEFKSNYKNIFNIYRKNGNYRWQNIRKEGHTN